MIEALVYDEPTVMWRMRRRDGLRSHAVVAGRSDGTFVCMWCVNERPIGAREFADWGDAIRWSERMQAQNWSVGWRLEHEYDDSEPLPLDL